MRAAHHDGSAKREDKREDFHGSGFLAFRLFPKDLEQLIGCALGEDLVGLRTVVHHEAHVLYDDVIDLPRPAFVLEDPVVDGDSLGLGVTCVWTIESLIS